MYAIRSYYGRAEAVDFTTNIIINLSINWIQILPSPFRKDVFKGFLHRFVYDDLEGNCSIH